MTDHSSYRNTIDRLRAERDATAASLDRWMRHYKDLEIERDKLKERVSELEGAPEKIADPLLSPLLSRRDIARAALEKIKFRNHPGTTNHELAKEALSRTSEEA
jgi:hypothetical protein